MNPATTQNSQSTTVQSLNHQKASLTRPLSFSDDSSDGPMHPPGLVQAQGERLWQPHEDKYWNNLRDMWGSNSDLNDFDADTDEASSSSDSNEDGSRRNSQEINGVHLGDRTGNTFKIDLAGRNPNRHRTDTVTAGGLPDSVVTRTSQERQGPNALSKSTPLTKTLAIQLPPTAHTKSKSRSKSKSKTSKGFHGSAINVTVTTTTRTYGDFSKANPPPYTPRPTAMERSFGSNGKMPTPEKKGKKWAVAKWLFIFGFLFPLCWLFGSFLLLSGLRKLNAQAQLEENESRNTKFEFDTPMSSRIYSHNETVAQRIAQEILWSKRCAWAFAALVAICIGTFAVLKALGM